MSLPRAPSRRRAPPVRAAPAGRPPRRRSLFYRACVGDEVRLAPAALRLPSWLPPTHARLTKPVGGKRESCVSVLPLWDVCTLTRRPPDTHAERRRRVSGDEGGDMVKVRCDGSGEGAMWPSVHGEEEMPFFGRCATRALARSGTSGCAARASGCGRAWRTQREASSALPSVSAAAESNGRVIRFSRTGTM